MHPRKMLSRGARKIVHIAYQKLQQEGIQSYKEVITSSTMEVPYSLSLFIFLTNVKSQVIEAKVILLQTFFNFKIKLL